MKLEHSNNSNFYKEIGLYTVINKKTGYKNDYSWLAWNIAWALVFIFGMITGILIGYAYAI